MRCEKRENRASVAAVDSPLVFRTRDRAEKVKKQKRITALTVENDQARAHRKLNRRNQASIQAKLSYQIPLRIHPD